MNKALDCKNFPLRGIFQTQTVYLFDIQQYKNRREAAKIFGVQKSYKQSKVKKSTGMHAADLEPGAQCLLYDSLGIRIFPNSDSW